MIQGALNIILTVLFSGLFRVAFVGDPQVDNAQELSYARKSIYRELRERRDLDMIVILGDLANDKVELLSASRASLDSAGVPWVCAPGNHDKDVYRDARGRMASPRDCATFSRVIHSPDTTFMAGGVRFILMDDVRISDKASYEGGLRSSQWHWLENVVSSTADTRTSTPVIFCTHIPVWEFSKEAQDSLQRVMSPLRSVQYVCGHTHTVRRTQFRGSDVLNAGATCGTWWRGVKDEDGVPWAVMNCGAPRGYFVADISPSEGIKRLVFKAVRRSPDYQMSASFSSDGSLKANVFGGAEGGVLQLRHGLRWITLTQVAEMAPELALLKEQNRLLSREYRRAHRDEIIPVLSMPSPHIWSLPDAAALFFGGKPGKRVKADERQAAAPAVRQSVASADALREQPSASSSALQSATGVDQRNQTTATAVRQDQQPAAASGMPAAGARALRLKFRYKDKYMSFRTTVSVECPPSSAVSE